MSNIRRNEEKSSRFEDYHRKRTSSSRSNFERTSNICEKSQVYVGNVPTDNLTDEELLQFFKPFGNISDIRVHKGYLFVQYDQIDDAKKLIKQGENCLILKGNKLEIFLAMNGNDTNEKSYEDYQNSEDEWSKKSIRYSLNNQPPRKRFASKHPNDDQFNFNNSRDLNENDLFNSSHRSRQSVHCRIILVNPRQRIYAEEMSCYLQRNDLRTSIILLEEDYPLRKAIQDASNDHCLYGIILMPMHQERHTASFHILHGHKQEHRNLKLEDTYRIILRDFALYKQCHENEQLKTSVNEKIYSTKNEEEENNCEIQFNEKFPLGMLLCLLADGRQLTLDEIDRILVYLLEKKAKMLTLPEGTFPPLPNKYHRQITNQRKCHSTTNDSLSSSEFSSTIIEQIHQILSTNFSKCSNEDEQSHSNSFGIPSSTSTNLSPFKQSSRINLDSQYIYPSSTSTLSNSNHYSTLTNSSAADAAAAIFQAYSLFNHPNPTTTVNK